MTPSERGKPHRAIWQRLLFATIVVSVPILLLALGIQVLATERFVTWEYGRHGFPSPVGMTAAERLALAVPATVFVVGRSSIEEVAALTSGDRALFTEAEIAHVVDVKRLVGVVMWLGVAGLAAEATGAVLWLRRRFAAFPRAVEWGGWLSIALVTGVTIAVGLAWPLFFVTFHEVLFRPGTWQFPADSGLIRLFPEKFWFDTAVALAAIAFAGGTVAVVAGRLMRRGAR